jgi:hypothetical protein
MVLWYSGIMVKWLLGINSFNKGMVDKKEFRLRWIVLRKK